MRLRHAHWQGPHAALSQPVDTLLAFGQELDVGRTVQAPRQRLDLLANWRIGRIERGKVAAILRGTQHCLGELDRSLATVAEAVVDNRSIGAEVLRELRQEVKLAFGVARESVDAHHGAHAEGLDDVNVRCEVLGASLQGVEVLGAELGQWHTAVRLERAHGRNYQRGRRSEVTVTRDDMGELLEAEV